MNIKTFIKSAVCATVLAVMGWTIPTQAMAANYYVSTAGNDASSGSITSPWRTVKSAIAKLQAGDTLFIRGGNYLNETLLSLRHSGTAAAPITITNYPGEQAILQGAANTNPGTHPHFERNPNPGQSLGAMGFYQNAGWGVYYGEIDYVKVIGTDVASAQPIPTSDTAPTMQRTSKKGLVMANYDTVFQMEGASYWEVSGLEIYNAGICGDGGTPGCTQNNSSYGSVFFLQRGTYDGNNVSFAGTGVKTLHTNFWRIHHNRIYNWSETGIQINSDYNLVENNEAFYGESYGPNGAQGPAMIIGGHHNIVRRNFFHDNGHFGDGYSWAVLLEPDMADNNLIEGNVLWNNFSGITTWGGDNNLIRNNLVFLEQGDTNTSSITYALLSEGGWCDDLWFAYQWPQCPSGDANNNCSYIHNGSPDCRPQDNVYINNTVYRYSYGMACMRSIGGSTAGACERTSFANNAVAGYGYNGFQQNEGTATFTANLTFAASDVTNPTNNDFRLVSQSALLDKGTTTGTCSIPDLANSRHNSAAVVQVPCVGESDVGLTSTCIEAIRNRPADQRVMIDDVATCFTTSSRVQAANVDVGAYEYGVAGMTPTLVPPTPTPSATTPTPTPKSADLNSDGAINGSDMRLLLAAWGPIDPSSPIDIDSNGHINSLDASFIILRWAAPSPTPLASPSPQPTAGSNSPTPTQSPTTGYFVRPNGVGDGSSWQNAGSLANGLNSMQPGQTLWVGAGTYTISQEIEINRSGTSDHKITVSTSDDPSFGGPVILQGASNGYNSLVLLDINGDNWVLRGKDTERTLNFTSLLLDTNEHSRGFLMFEGDGLLVENAGFYYSNYQTDNSWQHNRQSGITTGRRDWAAGSNTSNVEIRNSVFYNLGFGSGGTGRGGALYTSNTSNLSFHDNEVHHTFNGIQLEGTNSNWSIFNNTFHDDWNAGVAAEQQGITGNGATDISIFNNTFYNEFVHPMTTWCACGSNVSQRWRIYNNLYYRTSNQVESQAFFLLTGVNNSIFYNNVIVDPFTTLWGGTGQGFYITDNTCGCSENRNNQFFNNTFVNRQNYGSVEFARIWQTGGRASGNTFSSNLLYIGNGSTNTGVNEGGVTFSNNQFYSDQNQCVTNINNLPTVTNRTADGLVPQTSCSAVNAGTNYSSIFTTDFLGKSRDSQFDVGAYER